jgi:hypothetical protein
VRITRHLQKSSCFESTKSNKGTAGRGAFIVLIPSVFKRARPSYAWAGLSSTERSTIPRLQPSTPEGRPENNPELECRFGNKEEGTTEAAPLI